MTKPRDLTPITRAVALAKLHVLDGEMRVIHQLRRVERLEERGLHDTALTARRLLVTLSESLNAMRRHLEIGAALERAGEGG